MLGRRLVPLALLLAIAAAGCGSTSTASPVGSPAASVGPGASPAPAGTAATPGQQETAAPATGPTDTAGPTAEPSAPASADPSASEPGDAGSRTCSGSAENRDFFAAAAQAFTWDVYCAVLPAEWFVDTGSFRLADGGMLVVTYKGPGGARIELREGATCTTGGSAPYFPGTPARISYSSTRFPPGSLST